MVKRLLVCVFLLACISGGEPMPGDAGIDEDTDAQQDLPGERRKPFECFYTPVCGEDATGTGQLVYPQIDCETEDGTPEVDWCGYVCVICNQSTINRECTPNFTPRQNLICERNCSRCKTEAAWSRERQM